MDHKFSVIIPLYNVESYISDTITSVIDQTIGFEENIQLILVNDGSTDGTEKVCLEYRDSFPENIIYVYQENAGVSAARNTGMQYIKGKYVNFMDSDDLWDKNAFEAAWNMLEEHADQIDMVACRMDFFEAKTGYPRLDYKFADGDMICDIHEHPSYGQFAVASCFCKADAIADLSYDTRLTYGEDAKFINQLILKKECYGLLASAVYHIRRRYAESSLTQSKLTHPTAYLDTATLYYKYLYDFSREKYGCVIPYVQYAITNAVKFRVNSVIPDTIPDDVAGPYIELLLDLIKQTDDEVFCKTNSISTETRVYLLQLKHGAEALDDLISVKKSSLYAGKHRIGRAFRKKALEIADVNKSLLKTVITGTLRAPVIFDDVALRASTENAAFDCTLTLNESKCRRSFRNELMSKVYDWTVTIPALKCRDIDQLEWTALAKGAEFGLEPRTAED